jgi:hypothetical protein
MTIGQQRITRLRGKLAAEWTAFNESYAGMTDSQMMESGVVGDWSVKDIIAHLTIWENEALKHLPMVANGDRPPRYSTTYGGVDAFNAQMIESARSLSLADVRKRAAETHERLVAYLDSVPEDLLASESRFRRRLRLDTYSHYPIHTEQIRKWRAG